MDTKLNVRTETGETISIDVIDIFSIDNYNNEYILYTIENDLYASILIETDVDFTLKTIEDEKELNLVKARIAELVL